MRTKKHFIHWKLMRCIIYKPDNNHATTILRFIILTSIKLKVMRAVIIYKTKYGATKQYAEWLGESLSLPVIPVNEVLKGELREYDCILLGTSIYFGKFKLKGWLRCNTKMLINKKIFLFIVNATDPGEIEKRNNFIEHNVPLKLKPYCKFYFLPGRVIHKNFL